MESISRETPCATNRMKIDVSYLFQQASGMVVKDRIEVTSSYDNQIAKIKLSGSIDSPALESIDFPAPQGTKVVEIDLAGVKTINSIGIRAWINWIKAAPAGSTITLHKCSLPVMLQVNSVAGFLPRTGRVGSFYLPYFCDTCTKSGQQLIEVGKDINFRDGKAELRQDHQLAKLCDIKLNLSCSMEPEVSLARYLQFLNQKEKP